MQRVRVALLAFLISVAAVFGVSLPAAAAAPSPAAAPHSVPPYSVPQYYIALGDSLAQGVQPAYAAVGIPIPGGNVITTNGYPDQLFATLKAKNPALQLIKVGCPGESSTSMINGGGPCQKSAAVPDGYTVSQLVDAVALITSLRQGGAVIADITLSIGANDVLTDACRVGFGFDDACVQANIATLKTNLATILPALTSAAGPKTARAGMTFYDPLLGLALLGPAFTDAALQSLGLTNDLNRALTQQFQMYGFGVARVAKAFKINNTTVQPNGLPTNVALTCQYTFYCNPDPTLNNIHATTLGYSVIAAAFAKALKRCRDR